LIASFACFASLSYLLTAKQLREGEMGREREKGGENWAMDLKIIRLLPRAQFPQGLSEGMWGYYFEWLVSPGY
jgi:hypothetical protein